MMHSTVDCHFDNFVAGNKIYSVVSHYNRQYCPQLVKWHTSMDCNLLRKLIREGNRFDPKKAGVGSTNKQGP